MAQSRKKNISWAPVQYWNTDKVSVQCPFCTKIHTHGFDGSYDHIFRTPHCDYHSSLVPPTYRFRYPFSTCEGSVAYEVDKTKGFYVAVGAEARPPAAESLENAIDALSLDVSGATDRKAWEDATETITIGLEDDIFRQLHQRFGGEDSYTLKRLDHVLSRMTAFGDSEYVDKYLRSSPEADLFLFGTNEEGKSALSLAACERYPACTKLLLEHGAQPNRQDDQGRTPLMEAALWGRRDNVDCLLNHGADRKLRDNRGYQAIELAGPSHRNEEERYLRSGGEAQVYKENTFIVNQARMVIVEALKDPEELPGKHVSREDQTFESYSFKNTDRQTVHLIAPIVEYPIQNEWKAIASLYRPQGFPLIAAMSGWAHGETKVFVSGKEWTSEVMRISSLVGHWLEKNDGRDQGMEGQYHATHAEKQLIAYFIDKHVIIETEDDELLQRSIPPVLLKQATILVSRPPCSDCSQFIDTVNRAFGLDISVLDRSQK